MTTHYGYVNIGILALFWEPFIRQIKEQKNASFQSWVLKYTQISEPNRGYFQNKNLSPIYWYFQNKLWRPIVLHLIEKYWCPLKLPLVYKSDALFLTFYKDLYILLQGNSGTQLEKIFLNFRQIFKKCWLSHICGTILTPDLCLQSWSF